MQTFGKGITENGEVIHKDFQKPLIYIGKILIMQHWNVAVVLHNPKGIQR